MSNDAAYRCFGGGVFTGGQLASFRYGFRKVLTLDQGALKGGREETEFQHPFFLRGQPELLVRIKRRTPISATAASQNIHVSAVTQETNLDRPDDERVTALTAKIARLQAQQVSRVFVVQSFNQPRSAIVIKALTYTHSEIHAL